MNVTLRNSKGNNIRIINSRNNFFGGNKTELKERK